MIKKIISYIKDDKFKIIYVNNSVDIINYDKIMEVKDDVITLQKEGRLLFIKGHNLKLNKLLEQEILICGSISEIEL